METTQHLERELVWLGTWEGWVEGVVWCLCLMILVLAWRGYRELAPWWRRALLVGLRLTIVAGLLWLFYQPAWLEQQVAKGRNLVAVLVDVSASMNLPHGPDSRRIQLTEAFLDDHAAALEALSEANDVVFHPFGQDLGDPWTATPDAPHPWSDRLNAAARTTRLIEALRQLRSRYRDDDIGAVIVLTDGVDTSSAGLRGSLSATDLQAMEALDAPVHLVTIPDTGALRDLAVVDAAYNGFAFLMNASSLEATVRVEGYDGGQVTVALYEEEARVDEVSLTILPDQRDYPLTFHFLPKTLGKRVFTVKVEPQADEFYRDNNARRMVINVIRDKVRVLQIVGQPSWDARFLRNHLKQNPNVDLISFFILVGTQNVRPMSTTETALIPFPAQELFEEELGGFDLVIFQNFNYGPFQTRQYLPYIARFVRQGGAFAMVGGPLSLSAGGYHGTPITDVLPVEIPPGFQAQGTLDETPFTPRLTDAGRFHPITRLSLDPVVNTQTWQAMANLEGINIVNRARPGAQVLIEHPSIQDADGQPHPVVVISETGEGRSMVVTTDSTWHWTFVEGLTGGADPRLFDLFWSNAIRWLIKDPALDLVRVQLVSEEVSVGQVTRARILAFRPDYQPAARVPVEVVVHRRPDMDASGPGEEVLRLEDLQSDEAGTLDVEIPLEEAGIYGVTARAVVVEDRTEEGADLVVATDANPEYIRIIDDGRLVEALTTATQGQRLTLADRDVDFEVRAPRVTRIISRTQDEIWNAPWVLMWLVLCFSVEWWLRRRYGFL